MRALTDGTREAFIRVGAHAVHGLPVDAATRCVHWHGKTDIVALALPCCGLLHPCRECHDAVADHAAERWPVDAAAELVVLCGACTSLLSIDDYREADACPRCAAPFNPGCRLHRHLYFD